MKSTNPSPCESGRWLSTSRSSCPMSRPARGGGPKPLSSEYCRGWSVADRVFGVFQGRTPSRAAREGNSERRSSSPPQQARPRQEPDRLARLLVERELAQPHDL